eukprot:326904_1
MKLITLFVICLVVLINGDSSRLLLKFCTYNEDCRGGRICVNGQCQKQECPDYASMICPNPCLDPGNYLSNPNLEPHCPDGATCIAEAVIDPATGCELCPRFKECSEPECPTFKCADPCVDPNNNLYCSDGVQCISGDVFHPDTGCKLCPEFVECPVAEPVLSVDVERSCSTGCGKGWFCCSPSCGICTPDGGACIQKFC